MKSLERAIAPQVTIVMIDTITHRLGRLALLDTLSRFIPSEVYVWTDKQNLFAGFGAHTARADPFISVREYENFLWHHVPQRIQTTHYLVMQWDSWVVEPAAWDPLFLDWDYIGAPWWYRDDYNVGNGGFSLRSKRLGERLRQIDLNDFPGKNEDEILCRILRPALEKEGFYIASEEVAYRFSRERTGWDRKKPSFGFHGLFNFPRVLTAPRIGERMACFDEYVTSRVEYREMIQAMAGGGR